MIIIVTIIIYYFFDYEHVPVPVPVPVVSNVVVFLAHTGPSWPSFLLPGSRRMPWMEDRGVDELLGQPSGFVEWSEKLQWL